ncbi:hypothetical protein PINS_up013900 [Pythium insidiosum]|nr:hypothetical protein PINS_up013900 [Pythium insidiosum]
MLQTYQAYQISHSVSNLAINRWAVSMIVINCVYSPLLHVVVSHNRAARRVLNATIDLLLDFGVVVVVPIWVVLPRILQFDWQQYWFPQRLVWNNVWFVSAISECQQILVSNYLDYLSSVAPHFVSLLGLHTVKQIVRRDRSNHFRRRSISFRMKRWKKKIQPIQPPQEQDVASASPAIFDEFISFARGK